ncbi:nuclear transport factor 2 family protein [Saccharomonospora sp. NPDC046836]|uniref:nuclear transport factor 2 family protein n=1 Tax=Saccharomonospora sp. NPDC046836 TaxID=3156921 RepID=UPI0033FA0CA1
MTDIEERVRRIEDQLAIYQVVSRYGPAADAGATQAAVDLWQAEGSYEVDGVGSFTGQDEIAGLLESELHQNYIHQGSAHLLSFPHVMLNGDKATAINYAQLALCTKDGFRTIRIVASRWELVRTKQGWQVASRTNVLLDGSQAGRDLLKRGLRV